MPSRAAATQQERPGAAADDSRVSSLAMPSEALNQKIIRLLQQDGRMAFDVMAEQLGVSSGTVRNRVNGMRDAGMLSIVAVVDPLATDYEADAMLGIKVAPRSTPEAVAARLGELDEVVYALWVSGRYDLLVEVVCDRGAELSAFLNSHVHGHVDIAHVEVMQNIGMFKNQFLLKRHVG